MDHYHDVPTPSVQSVVGVVTLISGALCLFVNAGVALVMLKVSYITL